MAMWFSCPDGFSVMSMTRSAVMTVEPGFCVYVKSGACLGGYIVAILPSPFCCDRTGINCPGLSCS